MTREKVYIYDPNAMKLLEPSESCIVYRNSVETHARASFGFVLSLGLPFSVIFGPPNALVSLARNKTHKGAALPSISRLDFHAVPEREREIRDSSVL